jgi:hypothetical protein
MSTQIIKYVEEYFNDNKLKWTKNVDKPFVYKAQNKYETLFVAISNDYDRQHREMVKAYRDIAKEYDGVNFKVWLIANFQGNGLNLYEYQSDRYIFTLCNFELKPRSKFKRIFKLTAY